MILHHWGLLTGKVIAGKISGNKKSNTSIEWTVEFRRLLEEQMFQVRSSALLVFPSPLPFEDLPTVVAFLADVLRAEMF